VANDIFDELLGGGRADPATLAAALRRQNQLGQLGQLSGDRVLGPMGANLQAGAMESAQAVPLARYRTESLDVQRSGQRQQAEESEKNRALQRSIAAMNNERALDVAAMGAMRNRGLSAAQQAVAQRELRKEVERLSGKVNTTKLGQLQSALKLASGVLQKYPTGGIPGIGGMQNVRTAGIGTGLTQAMEAMGFDKGGTKVQTDIAPLMNIILQARSGAAVTDPELNRMLVESGLTQFSTDEDFRHGVQNLMRMYNQELTNLTAGYEPEVLDLYRSRGGLQALEDPTAAQADVGAEVDAMDDEAIMELTRQLLDEG
jgi:hypothetical protein